MTNVTNYDAQAYISNAVDVQNVFTYLYLLL